MFKTSALNQLSLLLIYQYNRSGSMFIGSLLDNHPQILSLPPYFFSFCLYWKQQIDPTWSDKKIIQHFIKSYQGIANAEQSFVIPYEAHTTAMGIRGGLNQLGADKSHNLTINLETLSKHLHYYCAELDQNQPLFRRFFIALHAAYYATQQLTVSDKPVWICYHPHNWNLSNQLLLQQAFGQLFCLQMIREPIQALAAIFDSNLTNINTINNTYNISIGGLLHAAQAHVQHPSAHYRLLKLEALHQSPQQKLSLLTQWLKIDWHDNLLSSSYSGYQWHNVQHRQQISGFNQVVSQKKYAHIIDDFDRKRLASLTYRLYQAWNYPLPEIIDDDQTLLESLHLPFNFERSIVAQQQFPTLIQQDHYRIKIRKQYLQPLLWYAFHRRHKLQPITQLI